MSSVAPIRKFADIPIYRFLSDYTADTDTDIYYINTTLHSLCNVLATRQYIPRFSCMYNTNKANIVNY